MGTYVSLEQMEKQEVELVTQEEYDAEVQILDELNTEYETARTLYNQNQSRENSLRVLEAGYAIRDYKPRNMRVK